MFPMTVFITITIMSAARLKESVKRATAALPTGTIQADTRIYRTKNERGEKREKVKEKKEKREEGRRINSKRFTQRVRRKEKR